MPDRGSEAWVEVEVLWNGRVRQWWGIPDMSLRITPRTLSSSITPAACRCNKLLRDPPAKNVRQSQFVL